MWSWPPTPDRSHPIPPGPMQINTQRSYKANSRDRSRNQASCCAPEISDKAGNEQCTEREKEPSALADPMHVALVCLCLQSPLSRDVCSFSIWKKNYAKGHSFCFQNVVFKRVGGKD